MAVPIAKYGGEILKFVGDGLLAIFPLSEPEACSNLLRAVGEAQTSMRAFNEEQTRTGRLQLNYGVGINVGDVMYGNIGSRDRLDFTVIGPAVNMASRLESLTKTLGRPVLVSKSFADMTGNGFALESLGTHPVRGFAEPIELFAFSG
jgi:adenylate cyclase